MVDKEQARQVAQDYLDAMCVGSLVPMIVIEATIERDFGWVFFWQSKKYLKTGALKYMIVGNAPIIVTRKGKLHVTGTAGPVGNYIKEFERSYKPNRGAGGVGRRQRGRKKRD